jgi:hypothetical protein
MRHGSLFSGIGGFDLAAEWMGWENVFHCEKEAYQRAVLKKRFPGSISIEDVRDIYRFAHEMTDIYKDGEVLWCERHDMDFADCDCIGCSQWEDEIGEIDILTGGFPCVDITSAKNLKAWPGPNPVCGMNLNESLAYFDPGTLSWKTRQISMFEDCQTLSEVLPNCGMIASGSLYPLPELEHLTDEKEPLLWRTPTSRDWKGMSAKSWRERLKGDLTPTLPDQLGGTPNPDWIDWLMGFPVGWSSKSKDLKPEETQLCQALHTEFLKQ